MRPARRLAAALAVAAGLVATAPPGSAGPAAGQAEAQQANQALVIVDTGTERREAYVSFSSETISGLEALQLAGMDPVARTFGSDGYAVCALCGRGCPADSSCLTCDAPRYWAYWRDDAGGGDGFVYSGSGAGRVRVGHGDVEAWKWGTGEAPAWEPFAPPQPTTTTTTAPAPTTTTSRPPSTTAPTAPPTTAGSGGPGTTAGGGGPAPTDPPVSGTATTIATPGAPPPPSTPTTPTSASATTSTSSPSSSSSLAFPSASSEAAAGGHRTGSTPASEGVDGDEVAAVGRAPDVERGGGSAASTAAFVVLLGLVAGAALLVRARRARSAG